MLPLQAQLREQRQHEQAQPSTSDVQQQQQSQPQHSHRQQPQQQPTTRSSSNHQQQRQQSASSSNEVLLPSFKKLRQTVNARDLYRRTPLIVAAKQGHLECAHLLVDAASNLFAVDREGNT